MDTTTLAAFRQGLYAALTRARDALFEVGDGLLTTPQPRSFVELSQAPGVQRRWPSLYAALADGRVDRAALRRLFAAHLPRPAAGERLVLGLDTSPIHRPEAHTLADRTLVYAPNAPAGAWPALPGWAYSTLVVLPDPGSSWTYVLDNQRVPSDEAATGVGTQQVAALLPLLPARPVLVADGHYGTATWVKAAAALPCEQLLRAKRTAVR
jgi:DDE superfamily endonuclease